VPIAFDWANGEIAVKSPDARIISRMKSIADALRANVFSEMGGVFDRSGEHSGFLPGY
jgi:hypothetical protein